MLNFLDSQRTLHHKSPPGSTRLPTKNILCVTLYFDDSHRPIRRKTKLPQGMGAAFLAGAFAPQFCHIKTYSEVYSGPLENKKLLAWPDLIVLTGLSNCLDRMLHITAYVRSKNPKVIVVAGGPPIRAFPRYTSLFFDYCCSGDIEQLQEVVREALGPEYVADEMIPRLDLAYWLGIHGHVETSRYCNFRCNFCSLTAEKGRYQKYDLHYIEKQFRLMGKRRTVHFIDNNFYGNDRDFFLARLALIDRYRKNGFFKYWSALVSGNFFSNEENLRLAAKSGCTALFSGVESFDNASLQRYNKLQNSRLPQVELISRCLKHGIAFWYGLFMDVYQRSVHDIQQELDFIFSNSEISLPGFFTIPIPLPGTPYFLECLEKEAFFPGTSLRHLDGTTLCMEPHSPLHEVVDFIRNAQHLRKRRREIILHGFHFQRRYKNSLNFEKMFYALASNAVLCLGNSHPFQSIRYGKQARVSHVSTTEAFESTYVPKFVVKEQYRHYFRPTLLTNHRGEINKQLLPDILAFSKRERARKGPQGTSKICKTQQDPAQMTGDSARK